MRFHLGGIPAPRDFVPDDSWKQLREPGPWLMQLLALPIGIGLALLVGALWIWATPLPVEFFKSRAFPSLGLVSLAGLVAVHELIHAMAHPQGGKSDRTVLGFWPSRLLFYAHYDGELTRNRFLAILAMPTLVISLLPLAVALVTRQSHGLVAWLSSMNILFACGDLFGVLLLVFQVPPHAVCHNSGWRTFWRPPVSAGDTGPQDLTR